MKTEGIRPKRIRAAIALFVVGFVALWQLSGFKFAGHEVSFNVVTGTLRTRYYFSWLCVREKDEQTDFARMLQRYDFKSAFDAEQGWRCVTWRKWGAISRTFIHSQGGRVYHTGKVFAGAVEFYQPPATEVRDAIGKFQGLALGDGDPTVVEEFTSARIKEWETQKR